MELGIEKIEKNLRAIAWLRKDLEKHFSSECFEICHNDCWGGIHVKLSLTLRHIVTFFLRYDFKEEDYRHLFVIALFRELGEKELTVKLLSKLFPLLGHYEITFEKFSQLWCKDIKANMPLGTIKTWQQSVERGNNENFRVAIEHALIKKEEGFYRNHLRLFQMFVKAGFHGELFSQHREILTLINYKWCDFMEMCSGRRTRFTHYLQERELGSFRVLFSRLWSKEIWFVRQVSLKLELPELAELLLNRWTLVICGC